MIPLTHKIKLNPTAAQAAGLVRACGCARFAWNWCLATYKEKKASGIAKVSYLDLKKEFNRVKESQFPWIYESPKDCNQQPFTFFSKALKAFYKNPKIGYPKFKKKGACKDSFYLSNDQGLIEGKTLWIPRIGSIKTTEELRFSGKILSYTISRTANDWFVSVSCELPDSYQRETIETNNIIGVDLGLKTFAVTSNEEYVEAPRPLKYYQKKLRRLSKSHSRKQKGSNNRRKSQQKLAKLHQRIANIRQDFIHKFTSKLLRENQTVVIEDLNIKGMMSFGKLAKGLSDSGLAETRRQLVYKAPIFRRNLVIADRFFPSSKMCSDCGEVKANLTLSDREHVCEKCGSVKERDFNASLNLKHLGMVHTEVKLVESQALVTSYDVTKLDSLKQELNPCANICTPF